MSETGEPYREQAWAYRAAGWAGVLPLPAGQKWPPPGGYTGWAGVDPDAVEVEAWADGPEGHGNIALRLPEGAYGLDVDDSRATPGGAAVRGLAARRGPPPPPGLVSSRDDTTSGIRLFRAVLPAGRRWRDEPAGHGAGIEAIHYGHRYAVVWPSVHPDTGRKYVWRRPDGALAGHGELPSPASLPELPAAWVEALSESGEVRTGGQAGHAETLETVTGMPEGEPCTRMSEASARGLARLREARDGAALHPAARDTTNEMIRLGHEGHAGARRALAEHYSAFVAVRAGGRGEDRGKAEAEWWRLVRGAVGKLDTPPRQGCDCALWAGVGVQFESPVRPSGPSGLAGPDSAQEPAGPDLVDGGGPGKGDAVAVMLGELLTPRQVAELPPPVPLVRGLLYMDTLAWLIGKSGSFKSFVALDLAAHVAGGATWAHREVRQGTVLFLAAEGSSGMTLRVRAWERHNGRAMPEDVRFLPRPVQARGAEWAVLVELVRRVRPVLVVVDTQARITVGIEENSNSEMGAFVEQLDLLRRAGGACVLVVHHVGRNGQDARGASAIDGAQDTELKIERAGGDKVLKAQIKIDKQKDGADTSVIDFEMRPIDLGEGTSSLAVEVTTDLFAGPRGRPWEAEGPVAERRILEVLWDHFSERGATKAELRQVIADRYGGIGKTTFYDSFNRLIKKGKIDRIHGTQRFEIISTIESPDLVRSMDVDGTVPDRRGKDPDSSDQEFSGFSGDLTVQSGSSVRPPSLRGPDNRNPEFLGPAPDSTQEVDLV